ncbi:MULTISPECIES: DUF6227 family protein [Streptomyces]|uniref:DUF6227 family protein n=1 Tax=Streptomyces TaxID=1883 RepID=UPI001E3759E7|nr:MULTISPECIES: DUF6227 family protein [Streptomyces]UFQ16187.1 DUF6227 family protein [Streptomyces huasconensis]WCL85791.1 DUF6227 family protein [Streptomyces sp. JCM 35825]
MSVPYETAYEPPESPEPHSPEEHLERLLGRALNSFDLPDEVIRRLDSALAHDSSLHSAHHSAGLHRETYRHTWLLADASVLTLWELVHNTAPGSAPTYEVYADEEEAGVATSRLPLPPDPPACERPVTLHMSADPGPRHMYVPDDSADHARRLLRRAENPDGDVPGEDIARLLRAAFAHQITQAFGRPGLSGEARLSFSLYEHAFLLFDGGEISLWEVEHTLTPDRRHMCEVYASEEAARAAMERRAKDAAAG